MRGFFYSWGVVLLVALAVLAGCSGGGTGTTTPKPPADPDANTPLTNMRLTIQWGQRSRAVAVPASALSCRLMLFANADLAGTPAADWIIERRDQAGAYAESWVAPTQVHAKAWHLVAYFYAAHNATGALTASAIQPVTLLADGSGANNITLDTTVKSLVIQANQTVRANESVDLVYTAFDTDGVVVAVSTGSALWTVTEGMDLLRFVDGRAQGLRSGTAMVTVSLDGVTSQPTGVNVFAIETSTNPIDGAVMVRVPAGEFLQGNDYIGSDEAPRRSVYLDGYWIYKYEVTVGQYRAFCEAAQREMPAPPAWGWVESHPMVNVSWQDARDYAEWANAQLPSEAQWEKAARGTDGREYPWGSTWDADKCNNWADHSTAGGGYHASQTAPRGSYYPADLSPYGAQDMAGNVWEWCADWYQLDYYAGAPQTNPTGPATGAARILRGGSWYGTDNNGYNYRTATRYSADPVNTYSNTIGFRCVVPIGN